MILRSRIHRLFMGVTCGTLLAAAGAGCGGDDTDPGTMTNCTAAMVTGSNFKYSTDALKLPSGSTPATTYSIDIDGDGKSDNRLKDIVSTVMYAMLDLQMPINMAVAAGDAVILMNLQTPDQTTSACSGVALSLAKAPAMTDPKPKFDGSDSFKVADGMAATLFGAIKDGKITTTLPKDQTAATEQKIQLTLPLAGANLTLALHGAHLEGSFEMQAGVPRITKGALHGVLSKADIDNQIIPTVASLLTDLIHKDPMGSSAKDIIKLFETATGKASMQKCMVMANCCKTSPATCKITKDEVIESPVGGVLAPDVQAFDAQGNWKPTAGGKDYNGMSVGLGFTAVKASY